MNVVMTPDFLAVVAGAVLSLVFSYFPKLNTAYAALEEGTKKLIMLGLLILAVGAIFALACYQVVAIDGFVCDRQTAISYGWMLFYAVLANQGLYSISPQTQAVKSAKA